MYPQEIGLAWGDGPGEVGLIPPAPERLASGPLSLAVAPDESLWVLDQVNGRIAHLSPGGDWIEAVQCPPGATDLVVDRQGRLVVLSLVNHRVTILDAQGEVATLPLPPALPLIRSIAVNDRGHVLVTNAYQQTFDLGCPDLRMTWPYLLRTRTDGIPAPSGGPMLQAVLEENQAALVRPVAQGEPREIRILRGTEGVASVVLLDSMSNGDAVVLLEWWQGSQVVRELRRIDAQGQPLVAVTLPPPPLTFPFREFALGGGGVVHELHAQVDGLHILTHDLGRMR